MTEVMRILSEIETGAPHASEALFPLVYEELRRIAQARIAHENPNQSLGATALVHEAYLRLVDVDRLNGWESRRHFFGAAAEAMRRILINRARDKRAIKRGGGRHRLDLDGLQLCAWNPGEEVLALDEAIQALAEVDAVSAELVKLRFFSGLRHTEAAQALGLSRRTADRSWAFARAWLYDRLSGPDREGGSE